MSLKILFPDEIEELAAALDGISEATAQAAQDGPQSLAAFRMGVQVAMAAMIKATGGQPIKPMDPIAPPFPMTPHRLNPLHRLTQLNRVTRYTGFPCLGHCFFQDNTRRL